MPLQLKFDVSTKSKIYNKGTVPPNWKDNYKIENAWSNKDDRDGEYWYSIVNGNYLYLQYGQDIDIWAKVNYIGQSIVIKNQKENSNGSIDFEVDTKVDFYNGIRTHFTGTVGVQAESSILVNGVEVLSRKGSSIDEFRLFGDKVQTIKGTVKPQETFNKTGMTIKIRYPNGEYQNSDVTVGLSLFNPNPVNYIPMSSRKGVWEDLNTNKGSISIRKNNVWLDKSTENITTSRKENTGKNRIRKNSKWLQAPPMKGEQAQ